MDRIHTRRIKLPGKYQPRQTTLTGNKEVPWLNVSGLWLEAAGFKAGDRIEITVSENTLVITNSASDGTAND